jgi:hypothetical protein
VLYPILWNSNGRESIYQEEQESRQDLIQLNEKAEGETTHKGDHFKLIKAVISRTVRTWLSRGRGAPSTLNAMMTPDSSLRWNVCEHFQTEKKGQKEPLSKV